VNALEAIGARTSVRAFRYQTLDDGLLLRLLEAAVRAPSAFDEQPWEFVVVEDRVTLRRISETALEAWRHETPPRPPHRAAGLPERDGRAEGIWKPDFDLLYGAPALVVVGARRRGGFVEGACWMAAENLLVAATSVGLGGCVVGSILDTLRTPEIRALINAPAPFEPIVPIILGVPKEPPHPTPRRPPEIVAWRK